MIDPELKKAYKTGIILLAICTAISTTVCVAIIETIIHFL